MRFLRTSPTNTNNRKLKSQLICRRTCTLYKPVPLIPIIKNLQADSSSKEWAREALNISKWLKCISKYFNIQLHIDLHTFKPALTKKSTRTDFIFVCPDLKSSPPIKVPCFLASSTTPGTFVFWGEPLMYEHCKIKHFSTSSFTLLAN